MPVGYYDSDTAVSQSYTRYFGSIRELDVFVRQVSTGLELSHKVQWRATHIEKRMCMESFADDYIIRVNFPMDLNFRINGDTGLRITNLQEKFSLPLDTVYRVPGVVPLNNTSDQIAMRINAHVESMVQRHVFDNVEICDRHGVKYTVVRVGNLRRSVQKEEEEVKVTSLESKTLEAIRKHMYRCLEVNFVGEKGRKYFLKHITPVEDTYAKKVRFSIQVEVSQKYGPYPHGSTVWHLNYQTEVDTDSDTEYGVVRHPMSFFQPIQIMLSNKVEEQENKYKTAPVQIFKRRVLR